MKTYEQYDLQHEEDPIEKISNEDYKNNYMINVLNL